MATCKKIPIVPQQPPPVKFELLLTAREAEAIIAICAKVGGLPETYRGATDAVSYALREAGAQDWDGGAAYNSLTGDGIYFN